MLAASGATPGSRWIRSRRSCHCHRMSVEVDAASNALPPGVTLGQVQAAVDRSGYPLQSRVAHSLSSNFSLQPEWGFVDRTTGDMRAIDLLASRPLSPERPQPRVRPSLVLLIECKRSDMPHVFFETEAPKWGGSFPHVAGLKGEEVSIKTDDTRSTFIYPHLMAIGLDQHEFIRSPLGSCSTVSKVARKGKDLELTGIDAYQGLVLPIRGAVEHFRASARPKPTYAYFQGFLVVGIAVIHGPMLSARMDEHGATQLEPVEWQRLWRHEPLSDVGHAYEGESTAIDVVHRAYLDTYINEHLLPFAELFGERVLRHGDELASGKGFVSGMNKRTDREVEPLLRPR